MVRPVAVGIDGSAASLAAAAWAAREAVLRRTGLALVSAWSGPGATSPGAPGEAARRRWASRSLSLAYDRIRGRHPALEVSREEREGPPVDVLLAAGERAQLLVLGSRGLGGRATPVLGSTGLRTAARARFPVALLPPETAAVPDPARPVLLALDVRDPADDVIAFAFEESARRGVELHARYAWKPSLLPVSYPASPQPRRLGLAARRETARLSAALRPWRDKWPRVRVVEDARMDTGPAGVAAGSGNACLTVLGHRTRAHGGLLVGPVTRTVLQLAESAVALVPHT
ncbi:universal stress protein [Streptomyces sp. NPDC048172]|uniref:universal stress protein n=1 Tax=Streptomyces sp. NPDC048172 TaxID=3365505 RepID=UPI003720C48A